MRYCLIDNLACNAKGDDGKREGQTTHIKASTRHESDRVHQGKVQEMQNHLVQKLQRKGKREPV